MKKKLTKLFAACLFSFALLTPLSSFVAVRKAHAEAAPGMVLYTWGKLAEWVNLGLNLDENANNIAAFAGGHVLEGIIVGANSLLAGKNWNQTGDMGYLLETKLADTENGQPFDIESNGLLGILGSTSYSLAQNPPDVKTGDFFYSTLANNIFGIKPVHAAGKDVFNTILEVWKAFRNIAYFAMIIILIVAGFMIMFRYQLGPRTEVTIFTAVPKILVSLLLITFSFAIGGFLLDLGIVAKAVIESFLKTLPSGSLKFAFPMDYGILRVIFASYIFDIGGAAKNALDAGILTPIKGVGYLLGGLDLSGSGIISALLMLILRLVTVVIAFYIFFMLLLRFAALFVYLIFSPMAFLWGALPGQQDTITKWFKNFMVNVLTFPLVYLIFNLALYVRFFPDAIQMPDIGMGTVDPATGLVHGTYLNPLIAFGILLLATKVPAFLEEAFDVVPSSHISRAGVDVGKSASKIPIIGGFLK